MKLTPQERQQCGAAMGQHASARYSRYGILIDEPDAALRTSLIL